MSEVPEGWYDGEIVDGRLDIDGKSDDLVMVFDVLIGSDQTVTCRHKTTGEYDYITQQVCEHLGMEWPRGIADVAGTVGRAVRVRVKHNVSTKGKLFVNAYISTPRDGKGATPDEIAARIAKLAGEAPATAAEGEDDLPF